MKGALNIVRMVSKNSILGIGIALLFGLILSSKNGNILQGGAPSPVDPSVDLDPVGTEINFLQTQISNARGFLKSTFKAPKLPKGLSGGKCRGPNCLGIFQAKGTRTSFNPFTGDRIVLGGSTPFKNITGSSDAEFAFNRNLINQGIALNTTVTDFIKDAEAEIQILTANTAV